MKSKRHGFNNWRKLKILLNKYANFYFELLKVEKSIIYDGLWKVDVNMKEFEEQVVLKGAQKNVHDPVGSRVLMIVQMDRIWMQTISKGKKRRFGFYL